MIFGSKNKSKNLRSIKRYIGMIEFDPHTHLSMDYLIDDIFLQNKTKDSQIKSLCEGIEI